MDQEEFKIYLAAQKEWIEVAKYYLGQKLGYDPGEAFVRQWIREHGEEFRDNWPSYSAEYKKAHNL